MFRSEIKTLWKTFRRFRLGAYLGIERTIDPRNPAMRIYIPHRNEVFLRKSVILDETLSHTEAHWKRLELGPRSMEES